METDADWLKLSETVAKIAPYFKKPTLSKGVSTVFSRLEGRVERLEASKARSG